MLKYDSFIPGKKEYFLKFISLLHNLEVLIIAHPESYLTQIFHNLLRYQHNSLKHLEIEKRLDQRQLEALTILLKECINLEVLLVITPSGIVEPGISSSISSSNMKKIRIDVEHYKIRQSQRLEIKVFKAKFKYGQVISHSNQYTLLLGCKQ